MRCLHPRNLRHLVLTLGFFTITLGTASDDRPVNLAKRMMNQDSCLLNRVTVAINDGVVAPKGMASVALARLAAVDSRTVTIVFSGRGSNTPITLRLTKTNERYYGLVDTIKGPIKLLECERTYDD